MLSIWGFFITCVLTQSRHALDFVDEFIIRKINANSNTNEYIWDDIKLGMLGGTDWAIEH